MKPKNNQTKNLILIVLLFSFSHGVFGQDIEHKNKIVIGGFMNFLTQNNAYPESILTNNSGLEGLYTNNTLDSKYTIFDFSPYFGKEIDPHLMVGLQLNYRLEKYKLKDVLFFPASVGDYERNTNQMGFGIFMRHILNPNNNLNFFIQPNIEYYLVNRKELEASSLSQEEKVRYFAWSVGAGMVYNINDKIRATLRTGGLTYINGKWEIIGRNKENKFSSFGANFDLSNIYFGFEIRL